MPRGKERMAKTVLIVDDEPEFVELTGMRLEAADYRVLAAYNGQEGLLKARGENVDLILLDLMMPGLNGFEVLERLKADERTRDVPVVMLTAKGDSKSVFKAESLGAADYLTKPYDSAHFLSVVQRHIR